MFTTKKLVTNITLSGFFIAMSIILQRFLVIPFGTPSLYRLSFGNVPIIMSSLFLGPLFGGIVGAASDLLGATLFPVESLLIWPIISSTLYGVVPWLFLKFVILLNKKVKFPLIYLFLGLMFVVLEIYIFTNTQIRHPFNSQLPPIVFTALFRTLFTLFSLLIMAGLIVVIYFVEKKYKGSVTLKYTGLPSQLALAILLMGLIVDVFYSSWWKMHAFSVNFLVSVFFHTAIMLILLPLQTVILGVLGNVYAKSHVAKLIEGRAESEGKEGENGIL